MIWGCQKKIIIIKKIPQTGWLKQQKLVFSQFWRLKVWDQVASIVEFWWGLSSWLLNGCFLPVSSHGREQKHKFAAVSAYKDTNPIIRIPPSWLHLNPNISHRPHLQTSSLCVGFQHYKKKKNIYIYIVVGGGEMENLIQLIVE